MNQQNLPEDVFKALGEKPLLMTGFKPTALIYTYTQPKHVQVIEIEKYDLVCSDVDKEVVLRPSKNRCDVRHQSRYAGDRPKLDPHRHRC